MGLRFGQIKLGVVGLEVWGLGLGIGLFWGEVGGAGRWIYHGAVSVALFGDCVEHGEVPAEAVHPDEFADVGDGGGRRGG